MLLAAVVGLAASGVLYLSFFTGLGGKSPQGGPPQAEPAAAPAPSAPAGALVLPPADAPAEALKEAALAVARQLMADFPNSSDPIGLMGTVHNRFRDFEEAEKWWTLCYERNPRRADVFAAMATAAGDRGQHEKALGLWRKAREIDPRLPGVYSGQAATLLEMGKPDEAIAALEQELKISPNDAGSLMRLGQAYVQRHEDEKAVAYLLRAADAGAEEGPLSYTLAGAYARLGQRDKAEEFLAKYRALKAEPALDPYVRGSRINDQTWAAINLSKTLTDAANVYAGYRDLRKAEEYLRGAAALDPRNRPCRQRLVELYRATGRPEAALEICEQLSQLAPRSAVCALNKGILLGELGQWDAGEQAIRKSLQLAPKQPAGYRALVQLLLYRGQHLPEAEALAETLVGLDPSAANYALLAEACNRNGDLPGARAALGRALELDPGNPQIRAAYGALQEKK